MSAAAWLMLLALALYVYDATVLLRANQLMLVGRGAGRWVPQFGMRGWRLMGKEPFIPNLLTPWQPLVPMSWAFDKGLDAPRQVAMSVCLPSVRVRLGVCVALVQGLILVGLPLSLFVFSDVGLTLVVMLLAYGACCVTLLLVFLDRQRYQLSSAAFWKLCFECLTCPPFCINVIRRLSTSWQTSWTLADVAASLPAGPELTEFKLGLAARIRDQLLLEEEGSGRAADMARVLKALNVENDE